jgi:hypothetical protein
MRVILGKRANVSSVEAIYVVRIMYENYRMECTRPEIKPPS